ncbi:MAG: MotA/TolQ/ExbB proton channel family protein [Alphaproteobacteria bacterium]|nr:MotA/TolQ/ExbB proton channel family protein [Alphaproteobacteria bacterium]
MKTLFRTFGLAAVIGISGLVAEVTPLAPAPSMAAAQTGEPTTLNQLLDRVREGRRIERQENQARLEEFRRARNEQQALLNKVIADVAAEEALADQLNLVQEENRKRIAELDKDLNARAGAFKELFGQVRQAATDMRGQLEASMVSAEYPGRTQLLERLASVRGLPTTQQLEEFWFIYQQEMTEQGKVSRFTAPVSLPNGKTQDQEVVRVGPFTAVSDGKYLAYKNESQTGFQQLALLQRQPSSSLMSAAGRLMKAEPGEIADIPVDPSRGQLLSLLIEFPTLFERIDQGKEIGYVTIVIGLLGALLALWRILVLTGISAAVSSQARNPDKPRKGNPLGRVLLVANEHAGADTETLELKMDEAILKELPKLEFGLNTMKVVTAAAPLLGLLGTVTGMITVFQTITLFGTGDPKLMAGGISQALVTTVIGLCVAIPMLLLASIASGRSKSLSQVLEEQAAGIVASRSAGGR